MLGVPLDLWLILLCAAALMIILGLRPLPGSGDRRCPECWYDLSRVVGGACPECRHIRTRPLDLYPTRRRWGLVAGGAVLATPALAGVYVAAFTSPDGRAFLVDSWTPLRLIGVLVAAWGAWLFVRTSRRWARAWSRGRASPHEWKALALVALLIVVHGACVIALPRAAVRQWGIIPAPIRDAFKKMIGDTGTATPAAAGTAPAGAAAAPIGAPG